MYYIGHGHGGCVGVPPGMRHLWPQSHSQYHFSLTLPLVTTNIMFSTQFISQSIQILYYSCHLVITSKKVSRTTITAKHSLSTDTEESGEQTRSDVRRGGDTARENSWTKRTWRRHTCQRAVHNSTTANGPRRK